MIGSHIHNKMISDICLIYSATTKSIFRRKEYFVNITQYKAKVNTIFGPVDIIEGHGKAYY